MRRYLGLWAGALAFGATAGAKAPSADHALLEWTCADARYPRLAGPDVVLPVAPAHLGPSRPAASHIVYVAADGNVTSVALGGDAPAVIVAADADAPSGTVVGVLARVGPVLYVAVAPADPGVVPPVGPEVLTRLDAMCVDGRVSEAFFPSATADCPRLARTFERFPPACEDRVDALEAAVRACPTARDDALAYQLCLSRGDPRDPPLTVFGVRRRTGAALPTAPRWGDAWYGVLRHGIPQDPRAPPDPAEVAAPPFADDEELEMRKQVAPKYPQAALSLGYADQRCLTTITIDAQGTATAVEGCPEIFHAAARDALFQWRWGPPNVDGEPGSVRTTVGITFKLQ